MDFTNFATFQAKSRSRHCVSLGCYVGQNGLRGNNYAKDGPRRFVLLEDVILHVLPELVRGAEIVSEVSMGKWWTTDLQKRVVGECLQLHGGYGFMHEYPISADYADAAVQSIYAGTNEIMKVIIARRMGLE